MHRTRPEACGAAAVVVAVVAGAVVTSLAAPATAAGPEVRRAACTADGGTFTKQRGLRSCTTTSTEQVAGEVVTRFWATGGGRPQCQPVIGPGGVVLGPPFVVDGVRSSDTDRGTCTQAGTGVRSSYRSVSTLETTLVRSQDRKGPVLTTTSHRVVATTVVVSSCDRLVVSTRSFDPSGIRISRSVQELGPVPLSECERLRQESDGVPWPPD